MLTRLRTHAGAGALKNAPNVAAVVASYDEHFAQWPTSLQPNPLDNNGEPKESREEMIDLTKMVKERLCKYMTERGVLPRKLIFFRDGLSEEQFQKTCMDKEYPQITAAIHQIYNTSGKPADSKPPDVQAPHGKSLKLKPVEEKPVGLPKVLLICAVKRRHTRFFPNTKVKPTKVVDVNGNPQPGTVVDNVVTRGEGQDFFLISHHSLLGTARPTHYVILKNELGASLEEVEQMVSTTPLPLVQMNMLTRPSIDPQSLRHLRPRMSPRRLCPTSPTTRILRLIERAAMFARRTYRLSAAITTRTTSM